LLDLFIAAVHETPSPCIEFVNKPISLQDKKKKKKIVKLIGKGKKKKIAEK
jgi:hypothetical protein